MQHVRKLFHPPETLISKKNLFLPFDAIGASITSIVKIKGQGIFVAF
jgi:hypothetical protein